MRSPLITQRPNRDEYVQIAVTVDEKRRLADAANARRMNLSEFVRYAVDRTARQQTAA